MDYSSLNWQPIEELPGYPTNEDDVWDFILPVGIVLRREGPRFAENNEVPVYEIIGHNIGGSYTAGCSCCAERWVDLLKEYNGWAYL